MGIKNAEFDSNFEPVEKVRKKITGKSSSAWSFYPFLKDEKMKNTKIRQFDVNFDGFEISVKFSVF
jgi:hypothetical protein